MEKNLKKDNKSSYSIFQDETGGLKPVVATILMLIITLILAIVLYWMVYHV